MDANGTPVEIGDLVTIAESEDFGLGTRARIMKFDDSGNALIEFVRYDFDGGYWYACKDLVVVRNGDQPHESMRGVGAQL